MARAGGKGNTHVNAHSCKDIVLFSHTDERGKSRADVFRSNNARNFIPGTAVGIFPKRGAGKRENANCAQEAYPNFAGHVAAVSVHRAIKERRIQRFPYPARSAAAPAHFRGCAAIMLFKNSGKVVEVADAAALSDFLHV